MSKRIISSDLSALIKDSVSSYVDGPIKTDTYKHTWKIKYLPSIIKELNAGTINMVKSRELKVKDSLWYFELCKKNWPSKKFQLVIAMNNLNSLKFSSIEFEFAIAAESGELLFLDKKYIYDDCIKRIALFSDVANIRNWLSKHNIVLACIIKVHTIEPQKSIVPQAPLENEFCSFSAFFNSEHLRDVELRLSDKIIFAHKVILSKYSSVFAEMFANDLKERNMKVINILDVDYNIFVEMLRYMYCGEVQNIQDIAVELLTVADKYKVESLRQYCITTLDKGLSTENAWKVYNIALMCNIEPLRKKAFQIILSNANMIKMKAELPELSKDEETAFAAVFGKMILNE